MSHFVRWSVALGALLFSMSLLASPMDASKPIKLTFDDGPNPKETPQVLAILKQYNIHATFFVMGQFARRYPDLIRAIKADGNQVENHTMTHPMLTKIPASQWPYQILGTNKIVNSILGVTPTCIRPPYGLSNTRVRQYIKDQHMQLIMWDLNSFDYDRRGVDKMVNWVVSQSKPGYDILMHDGGNSGGQTIKALPRIIEAFKRKGYTFAPVC